MAFGFLEFGDPAFAVAGDGAQFVEFGGVAIADNAAVFEVGGDFLGEGIAAEGAERGKILHALGKEGEIFFCER